MIAELVNPFQTQVRDSVIEGRVTVFLYPQLILFASTIALCTAIAFAYKLARRPPLDYDVYVVEGQSQDDRRIVQVSDL